MDETTRRRSSKILKLPPDVRAQVEDMIWNNDGLVCISDWLKEQGFDISYGAVGRHARYMNVAAQRTAESLERTKYILDRIERNPNTDMARAAQAVMMEGLMQRITTADEDLYEMPMDKVGRLVASFRRVDVSEKKLAFEMRNKIDLAFEEMEENILREINFDPALSAQFHEILGKAKEKMMADE